MVEAVGAKPVKFVVGAFLSVQRLPCVGATFVVHAVASTVLRRIRCKPVPYQYVRITLTEALDGAGEIFST